MIIIADCGGTKSDWALVCDDRTVVRMQTGGINPIHQIVFQFLRHIPVNQRHITGYHPDPFMAAFFQRRAQTHQRSFVLFQIFDMSCLYLRIIPPVFYRKQHLIRTTYMFFDLL